MKFCLKIYVTLEKRNCDRSPSFTWDIFLYSKTPFSHPWSSGINNRGSLWPHACLSALNSLRITQEWISMRWGDLIHTVEDKKRKDTGGRRLKEREEERECVKSQKFNWLSSHHNQWLWNKNRKRKRKEIPEIILPQDIYTYILVLSSD